MQQGDQEVFPVYDFIQILPSAGTFEILIHPPLADNSAAEVEASSALVTPALLWNDNSQNEFISHSHLGFF